MKTIVIQGAIIEEIQPFLDFFKPTEKQEIAGFEFYITSYNEKKIIISLTKVGIVNATESTMIAIFNFKPDVIINQGTCGAHLKELKVGTLIVGEKAIYLNKFKTPKKNENEGSNSLEWEFSKKGCYEMNATNWILNILKNQLNNSAIFGTLGSGDLFSRESDRIKYMQTTLGELSEDMETSAVYKTCDDFNIDHIGIRIVSNNELCEGLGTLRENLPKISPIIFNAVLNLILRL